MSINLRLVAATDRQAFHAIRRDYQKRLKSFPKVLTRIPKEQWPASASECIPDECWQSQEFLVQIFRPEGGAIRLSIMRVILGPNGEWKDGITWDEMQRVKSSVGFCSAWAVEIFPPDDEVVNVANIRHIWIVPAPDFAWRKGNPTP